MDTLEKHEVANNMYTKARQSELWSGWGYEIFKSLETGEIIISDFRQLTNYIPESEGIVKIGELDELRVEDNVTANMPEDYEYSIDDYRNVIDYIIDEANDNYEATKLSDME